MSKPEFVISVDCRNMSCPIPVLKTKKAISTIEVNQVLEMVATDPGSVADMAAWSKSTGHPILYQEQEGKEYFYYIQRHH